LHEKAEAQDERVRILHCLGATRRPELVERTIALTLSDFVRKQDRLRPLMSLSTSPAGRRAVLKLIKTHIDNLDDTLGRPNLTAYVIRVSHSLRFGGCLSSVPNPLNFINLPFSH
uniref:ERAP1_C domain-containing protein n=1 Tax=Schistocephalus solidus TaxID=70667 RepID=A0A183SBP4_SCHSO